MTAGGPPARLGLVAGTAGLVAVALTAAPLGLVVPAHRGLFLLVDAVTVAAAVGWVVPRRRFVEAGSGAAPWLRWVGIPSAVTIALVFVQLWLVGRTIVPYDNRGVPDQPDHVFMPLWLAPDLEADIRKEGGREAFVDKYNPRQVELELMPFRGVRQLTLGLLTLTHALTFGALSFALTGAGILLLESVATQAAASTVRSQAYPAPSEDTAPAPTLRFAAFICHASKDAKAAQDICRFLEAQGLPCWIAPRNVDRAADWVASIVDGLDASRALVLVSSREINESPHVLRELASAVERRKAVFHVRLDDARLIKQIDHLTKTSQWIRVGNPPLVINLAPLVEELHALAPASAPAREPPRATGVGT